MFDVLACCGLIGFLHLNFGEQWVGQCRRFLASILVTMSDRVEDLKSVFCNLCYFLGEDVNGKLIALTNTNIKLQEEIENLQRLKSENEELRKLLHLKNHANFSVIVARIVSGLSNDFTQSFLINVGKRDGVSIDDTVKNTDGLVGRIVELGDVWSRLLAITDMNSNIPVKIGKSGVNGIMTGGNLAVPRISTLQAGVQLNDRDTVTTSGYGICEDIPVGKIRIINGGVQVIPYVNFANLHYVMVLRKNNQD
ncbi:MAG: rod shape-determining protein MreC [Holosporaceae bacterium]|nr:rod shape-determining protein MreC [Holosporaceae bacterium]